MQELDNSLPTGTLIAEFRIIEILGVGGFGITYKAQDTRLDRFVAIKEFLPVELAARSNDSKTVMARTNVSDDYQYGLTKFLDEAKTLAKFNHPNIVRVHTYIEENGTAYLVMEYVEGEALDDHLKNIHFNGNMSESRIREIIEPILKGLAQVHKAGLLHRDIKPGNIYLQSSKDSSIDHGNNPMLIDFGAARQSVGEKSKSISAIISQGYAPPEQYTTRGKQGPFTDIYAVGAVMYYLVTGEKPIESTDRQHDLNEELPDPLTPISYGEDYSNALLDAITKAMVLRASTRAQNVDALQKILSGESPQAIKAEPASNDDATVKIDALESSQRAGNKNILKAEPSAKSKSSSGGGKKIVVLALAVTLSVAGYFGFTQYQQQQALEKQALIAKQSDNKAWKQADNLRTEQSYQLYLDNWPQGQYAQKAQQQLEDLKAQAELAKLNSEERAKLERQQTITKVQQQLQELGFQTPTHGKLDRRTQKAIEAFENKQNMLVTGSVDSMLVSTLNDVVEKERQKLIKQKDDADWSYAKRTHTVKSYTNYLTRHSSGAYVNQAVNSIDKIRWADAMRINTSASYQSYLSMQPNGDYVIKAKQNMDNANWALARKNNTINSYQNYIDNQQQGAYLLKAQENIAAIVLENRKVSLTINVTPKNADIKIVNAKEKYVKGVRLLPKTYQVEISNFAHDSKTLSIDLSKENHTFNVKLVSNMPKAMADFTNTLVDIPSGTFLFGCEGSSVCKSKEKPVREVNIKAFKLMATEVTFAMWDLCVMAKACTHKPDDEGWGRDNRPVINVSYNDVTQQFIPWLNKSLGGEYRLPSEAEWEYAARAGSTTQYPWGDKIQCSNAYYGVTSQICPSTAQATKPVKSYQANAFGLYDMQGNVWEWVQDCWNPNHKLAPNNGDARMTGDCTAAIHRGGSWTSFSKELRSSNRDWYTRTRRGKNDGFRLAFGH